MNMQVYLLAIYDIDFNHSRAFLLCFVGDTIFSKTFFHIHSFNMNNQKTICNILCFIALNDSANDPADEICAVYGSGATTITIIRNWFKRFRAGNFDLKDESSAAIATTNTDFIKAMLAENPRYNVRDIVDATNIFRKMIDNHLTKMEYVNRCEVWIPQL